MGEAASRAEPSTTAGDFRRGRLHGRAEPMPVRLRRPSVGLRSGAVLTLGLVTDVHFGPDTRFEGRLRKLSAQAPGLLGRFVDRMRDHVRPDLLVNLGDLIEDDRPDVDERRYQRGLELLRRSPGALVNVAGNHDCSHLSAATLRRLWHQPARGPLYRSFDVGDFHFVVLYTHERKDVDITLDHEQLDWLEADLRAAERPTVVLMHHSAAEQDLAGNRWFARAPHIALVRGRHELRALLRRFGRTIAVFNGHLHWNHLFVDEGIPYITVQSLVENVDDDAPGRPAAAYAVARLRSRTLTVEVAGAEPARYQFDLPAPIGAA